MRQKAGKSYGQNEYQKSGNDRLRIRGRIIGICADAERYFFGDGHD
jgi:hypothetical protein